MGGVVCEVNEVHFFKGNGSRLSTESQRDLATQKTTSLTSYHNPMRYYDFKTEEIKAQQLVNSNENARYVSYKAPALLAAMLKTGTQNYKTIILSTLLKQPVNAHCNINSHLQHSDYISSPVVSASFHLPSKRTKLQTPLS